MKRLGSLVIELAPVIAITYLVARYPLEALRALRR